MPDHPSPARPPYWKWLVCGLLLLATMLNYMDRLTLNLSAARIMGEFGLDERQYGQLESAFAFAFAVGAIIFGWMADRWNVSLLYPLAVLAWSAAGFATGMAQSFVGLMLCRSLLGLAEAGNWPCACARHSTCWRQPAQHGQQHPSERRRPRRHHHPAHHRLARPRRRPRDAPHLGRGRRRRDGRRRQARRPLRRHPAGCAGPRLPSGGVALPLHGRRRYRRHLGRALVPVRPPLRFGHRAPGLSVAHRHRRLAGAAPRIGPRLASGASAVRVVEAAVRHTVGEARRRHAGNHGGRAVAVSQHTGRQRG